MTERRWAVDFDPVFFEREAARGRRFSPSDAFRRTYEANLWGGEESRSGPGSSFDQTRVLRERIPDLCVRAGVTSVLDLPCGDGHWMSNVEWAGVRYVGADLLPEVVARAAARRPDREFHVLDLTSSTLPAVDLLLCRDCLVHLSFDAIARALENIRRAGITYLLTTTFPNEPENRDIVTGDWRPLNFGRAPFNFPQPRDLVVEQCTEQNGLFIDKSLGLWRVEDVGGGDD